MPKKLRGCYVVLEKGKRTSKSKDLFPKTWEKWRIGSFSRGNESGKLKSKKQAIKFRNSLKGEFGQDFIYKIKKVKC